MDNRKYVFVGNREYVLKEMMRMKLNIVSVWVIDHTFLAKRLYEDRFIDYEPVCSKKQLLEHIEKTDFEVLISNGNKYILPISNLKDATYINIHPSYLPDLKGKDPVNGACLFNRTAGATCHMMDDGIDTGKIISRIEIPMSDDLDAGMLYQLSFKAEVEAFKLVAAKNYKPLEVQPVVSDPIYYSMQPKEWHVDFEKGLDYLLKQVRAFWYKSHGVYFSCGKKNYRFFRMGLVNNSFVKGIV